jgi:8-oxo-dGTP pyrophosphatase MutT (NUDIX family)
VVPKGRIEEGQSADETALREAWEEAGLVGLLGGRPVGSYLYAKAGRSHHVTAYIMQVTAISDVWPERDLRPRRWVRPERALALVDEPALRQLLRRALEAGTVAVAV